MNTQQAAERLQGNAIAALETAAIDAEVTLDPITADAALAAGENVVLILPPRIVYDTYDVATCTLTALTIAASPDYLTGWSDLDNVIDALRRLDLDQVEPKQYVPLTTDRVTRSAFALTITKTITP